LVMPPSEPAGNDWGRASALFEGHGPKAILGQTPSSSLIGSGNSMSSSGAFFSSSSISAPSWLKRLTKARRAVLVTVSTFDSAENGHQEPLDPFADPRVARLPVARDVQAPEPVRREPGDDLRGIDPVDYVEDRPAMGRGGLMRGQAPGRVERAEPSGLHDSRPRGPFRSSPGRILACNSRPRARCSRGAPTPVMDDPAMAK
jgi:hypothetical protein